VRCKTSTEPFPDSRAKPCCSPGIYRLADPCADAKFATATDANAVIAARLSVFIAVSLWVRFVAKNAAGLLMPSSLDEHH